MSEGQQRYRVVERLAAGGMAEVFIAESAGIEGFKKRVAIKRVLPALSDKPRFIAMFLDEARLSANLSHSNVVQVFDIGASETAYFIVMEYVDGADLRAVIEHLKGQGKRVPVEAACFITTKICEGLDYAHNLHGLDGRALRIVHRDLSPPNVLITQFGEVKIVDFGLAKATSQLQKSEAGIIKGKFAYLSPEAATGDEVDLRTDIFAAGIILWEMLAGRRLFLADTDFETVKAVQRAVLPPIDPPLPKQLQRILERSLARDPKDRYQTAEEFGRALNAFLYAHGAAVGPFEIAEMVRGAMAARKRTKPDKSDQLDKLVEDVLLSFNSLQDEASQVTTLPREEQPKPAGYEDIGNWADEIAAEAVAPKKEDPAKAKKAPDPEPAEAEAEPAEAEEVAPPKPPPPPKPAQGAGKAAAIEKPRSDPAPAPPPAPAASAQGGAPAWMYAVMLVIAIAAFFAGKMMK